MELHLISSCQPGALTLSSSASYWAGFFFFLPAFIFALIQAQELTYFYVNVFFIFRLCVSDCLIFLLICLLMLVGLLILQGTVALLFPMPLDFHYSKPIKVNVCCLIESAGIYHEGFKDMRVTDVNFFYLWEVGRQNIRQLRATKLDDLPRLKDDQVAVILEGPCRTEVRK